MLPVLCLPGQAISEDDDGFAQSLPRDSSNGECGGNGTVGRILPQNMVSQMYYFANSTTIDARREKGSSLR